MFEPARARRKYAKVGIYGKSGAGKSHLALTFPRPAVIDLERGTDFLAGRFDFSVVHARSYDEVMAGVSYIESGFETEEVLDPILRRKVARLTERRTGIHEFETLIIDPITICWELIQFDQLLKVERSARRNTEDYAQKDWGEMKRAYKSLMNRLNALPMHIVVIGRLTDARNPDGQIVGERMEAEKSTEYAFDVIMKITHLGEGKRVGIIDKDRSGLFPVGAKVDNPSWEIPFSRILAQLENVSPLKLLATTWRERGIADDIARLEIRRLTGKERSADLSADEISALIDHFRNWQPENVTAAG